MLRKAYTSIIKQKIAFHMDQIQTHKHHQFALKSPCFHIFHVIQMRNNQQLKFGHFSGHPSRYVPDRLYFDSHLWSPMISYLNKKVTYPFLLTDCLDNIHKNEMHKINFSSFFFSHICFFYFFYI